MLNFHSGLSNSVNSKTAVIECLSNAFDGSENSDCNLLVIHSTVGHNFPQMLAAAKEACPAAEIIGCTGSGVIGREGVSKSMCAMALMALSGDEFAVAVRDGLDGGNSASLAEDAAKELKEKKDGINMIYILSAGLDLSGDKVIDGVEAVVRTGGAAVRRDGGR